jgi:hypothetical protein
MVCVCVCVSGVCAYCLCVSLSDVCVGEYGFCMCGVWV